MACAAGWGDGDRRPVYATLGASAYGGGFFLLMLFWKRSFMGHVLEQMAFVIVFRGRRSDRRTYSLSADDIDIPRRVMQVNPICWTRAPRWRWREGLRE